MNGVVVVFANSPMLRPSLTDRWNGSSCNILVEEYSEPVHHMDNSTDDLSARADRLLKRNAAKDARELESTLAEGVRAPATMTESDL